MKLGRLIQYNRNTFVEKSYPKCGGETIPRPFSKIEFISNVLQFLLYANVRTVKI